MILTPTKQQKKIIDHFNGHALIIAGPGSGKTTALIEHVNKLISSKDVPGDDIWVMAFNRDISAKLKDSLIKKLNINAPQASTIHSFIMHQTANYGPELLKGYEVAELYLGDFGFNKIFLTQISSRLKDFHGIKTTPRNKKININFVKGTLWNNLKNYWLTNMKPRQQLFDKFLYEFNRLKNIYKIIFFDELAINFLDLIKSNPMIGKEVAIPRIIIDEFQDLNPTEHDILDQFSRDGSTFMVFGDDDQAINEFRKANANYIYSFIKKHNPISYPLDRDRRCPKIILDLADEFVKNLPKRISKPCGYASHRGGIDILCFDKDEDEIEALKDIITRYINVCDNYNEDDNPKILVLSSSTGKVKGKRVHEIIESLRKGGIDSVTGDRTVDPLDNKWGLAFKSLSSILTKNYTPMLLASWLFCTNNSLMKKILSYIDNEENQGNSVDFLNAFLALKEEIKSIDNILSQIKDLKEKIKDNGFKPEIIEQAIPNRLKKPDEATELINQVWLNTLELNTNQSCNEENNGYKFLNLLSEYIDKIKKPEIGKIHVTTYRKAKGLEAGLVIVTSSDNINFPDKPQARRLLFVATTRAKRNLLITFSNKAQGARRYSIGRPKYFSGVPKTIRSLIIPRKFPTTTYSKNWLINWYPF